ncbi:hypothetical protein ACLB2K_015369 [Fragaria x ananassa]
MDLSFQLITLIAVFLASLIYLVIALLRGSKHLQAPEPKGAWPIIGHLHLLGGGDQLLYRTLGAMADKYGPAFNIRLGSRRAFVVSSWEVAKDCFTTNDKALASRPTTVAAKHMGYNYAVFGFAPYSPFWREMRKIATLELLSNRRLEMLKHVRSSEVDMGIRELHGLWVEKGSCTPVLVEMKYWSEELTLNVVVRMVGGKRYFGTSAAECDEEEARLCQKAISQFFHLIGIFVVSDALPYLWWLDLQGHEKAMKKTAKDLDQILGGWLEEHRRRRLKSNNGDHLKAKCAEGEEDFIDVMLSLQEQGQLSNFQHDSDTSIKSTCLAIFLGGSDTTAGTRTWAISLLRSNYSLYQEHHVALPGHEGQLMDMGLDQNPGNNNVQVNGSALPCDSEKAIDSPSTLLLQNPSIRGSWHSTRKKNGSCKLSPGDFLTCSDSPSSIGTKVDEEDSGSGRQLDCSSLSSSDHMYLNLEFTLGRPSGEWSMLNSLNLQMT